MTALTGISVPSAVLEGAMPRVRVVVEYWTVAMGGQASCGSCDETLTSVNDAVDAIRPLAARLGISVDLHPHTITTWAEALDHQIVASPTLRAAGIELRPSHPDGSESRVWAWRGATTTSAEPEALLDFLLQAVAARSRQLDGYLARGGPAPYVHQFLQAAPIPATSSAEASAPTAFGGCGCTCG